jgi:hypothetical protein
MIGSVTPAGRVMISFNSVRAIPVGNPSITTGSGDMVRRHGQWTFNMQMASGSSSTQIAHWAFIEQCAPGEPCWSRLPVAGNRSYICSRSAAIRKRARRVGLLATRRGRSHWKHELGEQELPDGRQGGL